MITAEYVRQEAERQVPAHVHEQVRSDDSIREAVEFLHSIEDPRIRRYLDGLSESQVAALAFVRAFMTEQGNEHPEAVWMAALTFPGGAFEALNADGIVDRATEA